LVGARPSGTVTFLFTDIEGSSRLWETDPDGMRLALAAHDEMVRAAVAAHHGYVFSTGGDGVAVAFARAAAAVDAAVDAQRVLGAWPWPPGVPLRVRMGIATGEAEERDGDYFGPVLNRAARVMAAGHGGQILLAAVRAGLVDGVDLVDLGVCRLRDLSAPEQVFQVRAEGLRREFPPLRTADGQPVVPQPGSSTAASCGLGCRAGSGRPLGHDCEFRPGPLDALLLR
jgi:class 3 adenylate cyclase